MSLYKSHKPRKRFGQNFLQDSFVIDQIIHAISPSNLQTIVEIGPGQGAITAQLLEQCQNLHLIEIDRDLIEHLQTRFSHNDHLHIHNADALKFRFCDLAMDKKIRLVGNLPYNISTPLLFHILENSDCIDDMHFMLQKEVVDRMSAEPGSKTYGRLSVMIQYHCQVESLFKVAPESFSPAPKVDSAIVRLNPYDTKPYPAKNHKLLARLVNQAFSLRRKTLRNAVKTLLDEDQIKQCGIDPKLRPEMLSLEQFVCLSDLIVDDSESE